MPKIKVQDSEPGVKKNGFTGWVKCPDCSELVHETELRDNHHCCPNCDHHFRVTALQRIDLLADPGTFKEMFACFKSTDPLNFVDSEPYPARLKRASASTGRDEAVIVGGCTLGGFPVALGVLDFGFMGGSMGSVVGERLTCLIEYAIQEQRAVIIVSASGGARMQESILSLMQMAKVSAALAKLGEHRLPYISVLTNPTLGGITASFASLGDLIIAEPDALIGFAGPRVVEQTIRQKLPPKAQTSEFLQERGMIDGIVSRHELKAQLSSFLEFTFHGYTADNTSKPKSKRKKQPMAVEV